MPPIYVTYKDKLIELQTKQGKEIVVTIYKIGFRSFETENEIFYSCKQNVKILTARSVLEELTGEIIPCFLVQKSNQLYLFAISSNLTKLTPLRKVVESEVILSERHNDTWILDGPAVLSVNASTTISLFMSDDITMCNLKRQCFDLSFVKDNPCYCSNESPITGYRTKENSRSTDILHVSHTNSTYLLFLRVHRHCKHSQDIVCLSVLEYSVINGFTLANNKEYVPEEYHSQLTCLYHYHWKNLHGNQTNKLIIGTSGGFILVLENGNLLNCVSLCSTSLLPLPLPVEWIYFSARGIVDSQNVFLAFHDHGAVAINKELKIIKTWTGIARIFPFGYSETGAAQFLLFKGDTFQDGWILTDLYSLEISSDPLEPDTFSIGTVISVDAFNVKSVYLASSLRHQVLYSNETLFYKSTLKHSTGREEVKEVLSESLGSAAEALEKKLQDERLVLHEKEQQCRQCKRFTREVSCRQLELLEGKNPCPRTENLDLLPLVENQSQISLAASNQSLKTVVEPDIEIVDLWQRTYNDKWLVAVSFKNNSNCDLFVSVCLIPSNRHGCQDGITCHSSKILSKGCNKQTKPQTEDHRNQVKWPRTDFMESISASGDSARIKEYKEPDIAVCRTSLPKFSSSNICSVAVIVRWFRKHSSTGRNNHIQRNSAEVTVGTSATRDITVGSCLITDDSRHVFTRNCGELVLTAEDIVKGRYEISVLADSTACDIEMQDLKDMKRDTAALAMMQETTPLEVRSTTTILNSLEQLLEDRCHFSYNHRLSCYVTQIPQLSKVQLQLKPFTGSDKRIVKTYTSCDKDLFLLVHHLYASLPDHVIILHQKSSASDLIQSCLPSLHREINFLSHGVRKLLDDPDSRESVSTEACGDKEEDVRKVGEKFKRQRERMMEKMKKEVNEDKLKDLQEQLNRRTLETDSEIVKAMSKQ